MKYTITLQRKIDKITIDSLLVLITEDRKEYYDAVRTLTLMLERNKTFIRSSEYKKDEVTRYYLEYEFQRNW